MKAPGTTLLIGASLKPYRYSYMCLSDLQRNGFPVEAIGLREGELNGVPIRTGFPELRNIHTVTLYLGPQNQPAYYDYILSLGPARVIFNPGTENPEFQQRLEANGIRVVEACSIMMLHTGAFFND